MSGKYSRSPLMVHKLDRGQTPGLACGKKEVGRENDRARPE